MQTKLIINFSRVKNELFLRNTKKKSIKNISEYQVKTKIFPHRCINNPGRVKDREEVL